MTGILSGVPAGGEFASSAVLPVLQAACEQAGLSSDGAGLLRLGENAIFGLADDPVVVRIARSAGSAPRVSRELCVARWLAASGVPGVQVLDEVEQPMLVVGHPVSFWRRVSGGEPKATHADLARLLAGFHRLGECPCPLEAFEPFTMSQSRLAGIPGVDAEDQKFLQARCVELAEEFRRLEFALAPGPIHGDAWIGNLLTDRGQVVLADFESAGRWLPIAA